MLFRRQIKQLTYAAIFAGSLFLVTSLLLFIASRPASPVDNPDASPSVSEFAPLILEETATIAHGGTIDAVVRLRNPNTAAGIARLPVTFELRDSQGTVLASRVEDTYLLPGSTRYVMTLDMPLKNDASLTVTLPQDAAFTRLPPSLPLPQFNTFLYNRTRQTSGTRLLEEQKGVVTNGSAFDFERVEMAVIGFSDTGRIVAVGKTFIGRLSAAEQREFTVLWQQPVPAVSQVISQPSTNIFLEENIIRIIGDPALLR